MPPFEIDPDTIRTLAQLMTETSLSEIEVADGERRIRVSRGAVSSAFVVPPAPPAPTPSAPPPAAAPAGNAGAVTSPMVGTAYLQAEPGAPPFVSVGATVKVGDTLVIIEAMKVMNPIKAPRGGVVRQVLIADGQPVEYGEPLMIVE